MTPEKMSELKQRLLAEHDRLGAELAADDSDEQSDSFNRAVGELADYDPNDPADEASNLYDRDRESTDRDNIKRILSKVDRALAKMDDGTYGLSDVDGTPIAEERLEVLPYAVTTAEQEDSL